MNKNLIFRVIIKIIVGISIILMAFYGVVIFTAKGNISNGDLPNVFGFNYLPVLNDTMEPLLNKGEAILVGKNDFVFEDNQVVVVKINSENKDVMPNSVGDFHIVKVSSIVEDVFTATLYDSTKTYSFSTNQILGKATYSIPFLGTFINKCLESSGLILFLIIPLILIIAGLIVNYKLKVSDDYDYYEEEATEDETDLNVEIVSKEELVSDLPMVKASKSYLDKSKRPLTNDTPVIINQQENTNVIKTEIDFAADLFNEPINNNPALEEGTENLHPMFKKPKPLIEPIKKPMNITPLNKDLKIKQNIINNKPTMDIPKARTERVIKPVPPIERVIKPATPNIKNINPIQIDNMNTQELASVLNNVFLDNPDDFNLDFSELHKNIDSIVNERKDEFIKQENEISLAETMSIELALINEQLGLTQEFSSSFIDKD